MMNIHFIHLDSGVVNMNPEEHKEKHIKLHKSFDELTADYVSHTEKLLSETTVMELIEWSYSQTINPKESKNQ